MVGNFITDYTENYTLLDRYFVKMYGDRVLFVDKDEPLTDTIINWNYDIPAIVFSNLYSWAKMYSALNQEYNPIWNVDGTVTEVFGKQKTTDTNGARTLTDTTGQQVNTYGQSVVTYVNGQKVNTNEEYNVAYPDATENEVAKNVNTGSQSTDTTTAGSHDITAGQRVDTHTSLQVVDTHENDSFTNTTTRAGNIGVTETSQLITNEIVLRRKYPFFAMIFACIAREEGLHYE